MANEENPIEMKDEGANLAPFHPSKKRKKNKVLIHDPADGYVEQLDKQTESLSGTLISQQDFFSWDISSHLLRRAVSLPKVLSSGYEKLVQGNMDVGGVNNTISIGQATIDIVNIDE
ncbi:hypothetical protein E3N88_05777 [Mikania micrantha]|uniref:Uncharacterized protein n=1 Tax=Mikania micrantha TaxID=192012 RepID=A0A5N6PMP0_9ASTR|nr:hypothetical protein E3N88_05777 [Mikania micrantha]